jgi:hypothetical protein
MFAIGLRASWASFRMAAASELASSWAEALKTRANVAKTGADFLKFFIIGVFTNRSLSKLFSLDRAILSAKTGKKIGNSIENCRSKI